MLADNINHLTPVFVECDYSMYHWLWVILLITSESFMISVPPDVSVSVTENDTGVVFTCFPKGEPQIYTFSPWTHIGPDGHTVIRQLPAETNGGLTLPGPVTYEDSGYYRCTVNNGVTGRSSQLDHIGESGYFSVGGELHLTSPVILLGCSTYKYSGYYIYISEESNHEQEYTFPN